MAVAWWPHTWFQGTATRTETVGTTQLGQFVPKFLGREPELKFILTIQVQITSNYQHKRPITGGSYKQVISNWLDCSAHSWVGGITSFLDLQHVFKYLC